MVMTTSSKSGALDNGGKKVNFCSRHVMKRKTSALACHLTSYPVITQAVSMEASLCKVNCCNIRLQRALLLIEIDCLPEFLLLSAAFNPTDNPATFWRDTSIVHKAITTIASFICDLYI